MNEKSFKALAEKLVDTGIGNEADDVRLIAFYLPQYHRIPENSEWWSPGFTEWTNVARGKSNYAGHVQPKIPRELGFYDLSHIETMREQSELAKLYGVSGFCFYHYWFSGRRILEKPVDQFVQSDIDIDFCICWANENWTRTWDGLDQAILLEQKYLPQDELAFIKDAMPYLLDRRYIKVDGKPLLMVYRAKQIPDPAAWFRTWRSYARENGLEGLHICAVDFYDVETADDVGADALIEFPPHKFNGPQSHPNPFPTMTNPDFRGGLVDYSKVIAQSANREPAPFRLYRGIMPGWDNTARRQDSSTMVVNASPEKYQAWLEFLRYQARAECAAEADRLIFVNAWNEWGEGCYLEPDQQFGLRYLEATLRSRYRVAGTAATSLAEARQRLFAFLTAAEASQTIARMASGQEAAAPDVDVSSNTAKGSTETFTNWGTVNTPSRSALLVSSMLRRWPTLHALAARLYRWIKAR